MGRIEVRPGAAIALSVLLCLDPAGLCAPFLAAAALHEAGHLLALRLCRVQVLRLTLSVGGAVLDTAPRTPKEEALCAAAGPTVNLLLWLIFRKNEPIFSLISLLLALWNLLPVFPLDGGRIAGVLFSKSAHLLEGLTLAALVCLAAAATAVLHMGLWPILLALSLLAKLACARATKPEVITL